MVHPGRTFRVLRLGWDGCRLKVFGSTSVFSDNWRCSTAHGPKQWPWWKLFAVSVVNCHVCAPSSAWNVWVYTRWFALQPLFIALDRRHLAL